MTPRDVRVGPAAIRSHVRRWTRGWLTAIVVLVMCTLVGAGMERHFEPSNLITVYLAGVVYVALRKGRTAAMFTLVGSIILFDLLFVAPRWSLKPTDPQYFFTFAVALLVGLVISQLAASSRQDALTAQSRARRAKALNELALELAQARASEAVAAALEAAVKQALGRPAQLLLVDEDGQLSDTGQAYADERHVAERALREQRETGAGTEVNPHARRRYLPLLAADGPLGALAVERLAYRA